MMNLTEYRKRPSSLADFLPWACLVASGVILNKDGSFQRTARFRGPDLDSTTEDGLVSLCARVNNALKRYGSGWALFFESSRHPARHYPESDWRDPLAWLIDEERRGHFAGTESLYESQYHLTFTYLPRADRVGTIEGLLIEAPDGDGKPIASEHLTRFIQETDRALDLFGAILPEATFLSDDGTLTYLQSTVSTKRHSVRTPDSPAYLDAVLGGTELVGGLEPTLGGQHMRVVSVRGFPNASEPGLLDALNSLGFSYRWMTRYLPMDKADATKVLSRYRRQWFAKRKSIGAILKEVMTNEASALVNTNADNQAADADAALQSLGQDYVGFGYVTTAIVVHHENAAIADERIRQIERVVNGRGFVTIRESVNAVDAWLGTIPGNAYANIRQPIIHSLNLAHMMPLSAIWAGPERNEHLDGPPLLYATTGSHTPFRLVTHQGDVGHTLVVGPTGAGKSVLLSLLALQFRRYEDAQVFIFDKGESAKAATWGMMGDHYALGGHDGLCFQPLADIDRDDTLSWAREWVCGLLANESVEVTPDIKETVWTALTSLASAARSERTLTGLVALLQSSSLRQALLPYTLDGAHGGLLDADNESLSDRDWQCFEMDALMNTPSLVLPVLTYLFHKLESRFDGRSTLLVLDEAWIFLDDPLFSARIREWLKVLRKKNVSVIFATQSLSDVANSSIAPAIIESCPSRIFLPNDRAMEPQQVETYQMFGLNKRQVEIIAQATPKQDYYFQSRAGNRLFDVSLGPIALSFCGISSKDDLKALDTCFAQISSNLFAADWLKERGLLWAADLLSSHSQIGAVPCAAE